ncbi:Cytochrome P450 [Dillenia turbinata]|uniref:Cytochrome P450 n=1 Tax=Dillenia turbinata TaxID=194707 RepID=A0AAN8ZR26_9MAGN
MRCHDYHKRSLGLAPHGTYWRVLRRICTVDMLVAKRINETAPIRRKCVDQMIAWLDEEARNPHTIDVGHFIYLTLFNMVGNLMLSRDLLDPKSKEGSEFCKAMHGMIQWAGKANMSDAFPWLRWLDLQGVRRRVTRDMGDVLRITSGFLRERMEEIKKGVEHNRPKDFLDVLIEFEGDGKDELTKLSEQEITVVVLELFIAASETTSSTTEWILAELFHKPDAMELTWNAIVWCAICFIPILIHLFRRRKPDNFPPGPSGYPIIGNIVDLSGSMPHRDLARMKEKYGPVIGLKIGSARTVVISSAKTATEFFKNHDLSFADRAIVDSMRCHDYHKRSLGLAPHGTYWRVLRRICTVDMLVAKRINETAPIRRKCVDQMIAWLDEEARNPHTIDVGHFIYLTLFNMVGNLMLSRDLLDPKSKEGSEFCKAMHGMIQWAGKANMSDAFPWLRWLDLQGVRRRVTRDMGDVLRITSGFLRERMEEIKKGVEHNRPKDFLDVLIEFEGDGKDELTKLSEQEITVVVLVKPLLL